MPYALDKAKILIVDDMKPMLSLTTSVLKIFGFKQVFTAVNGEEAFQVVCKEDPDLIITDVRMPVVSGIDVFKGLRAALWKTPVVILTAFDTPEVRDAIVRFGAVLLIKPIDLDELEAVIDDLLTGTPRAPRASS